MADYDETDDQQPGGAPSPLLQQFRGLFTHPAAQKWADEAVTILNHGFQQRRLAQQNLAAGQNFVNDLDQFKTGLVSMVQNDPLMVHTALDLVHPTLGAVISTMPGAPEDADDHHAALTAHMEHDIAHAAVLSAAERNEGVARSLLASDRISGALGDSTAGLDTYISQQASARSADAKAQADAAAQMREDTANSTAINYLGALYHAPTGRLQFPPGWNQAVTADLKLPPAAKLTVQGVYNRLQRQGDVAESNPFVVSDLVKSMASDDPPHPADILAHAGGELKLSDALHLASMTQNGPVQANPTALANALQEGEAKLAPPENGAAGESAFGRFTNWLMSAVRGGANLDPSSDEYVLKGNRVADFAPNPADFVTNQIDPALPAEIMGRGNRAPGVSGYDTLHNDVVLGGQKRSLADILLSPFKSSEPAKGDDSNLPPEDEVLPTPRIPPDMSEVKDNTQIKHPMGPMQRNPKVLMGDQET